MSMYEPVGFIVKGLLAKTGLSRREPNLFADYLVPQPQCASCGCENVRWRNAPTAEPGFYCADCGESMN
jgi:hypothetical protein